MTWGSPRKRIAIGAATAVAAVGLIATPAYAYPPGQNMTVSVSDPVVKPGTVITATATHVQPGCKVYGTIAGPGWSSRQSTVLYAADGTASISFAAPSKPGFYRITAISFGKGCVREYDATYLVVTKPRAHIPPKWWHGKPWQGSVSNFPKNSAVTFTVYSGDKAVGSTTKTTDGSGAASFVSTINSKGSYRVVATCGEVSETSTVTIA
ncbi:MAG: hypothetical protein EPO13_05620 [Actinomycetota bacterium]|nr:MAG: hypothetical protein EPO13_05620 [Actinomycetota bacterium]